VALSGRSSASRDAGSVLVGDEGGVAVALGVEDLQVHAGMRALAAHDQPRSLEPGREVDIVGQLGDPGALALFGIAVDRALPCLLGCLQDRLTQPARRPRSRLKTEKRMPAARQSCVRTRISYRGRPLTAARAPAAGPRSDRRRCWSRRCRGEGGRPGLAGLVEEAEQRAAPAVGEGDDQVAQDDAGIVGGAALEGRRHRRDSAAASTVWRVVRVFTFRASSWVVVMDFAIRILEAQEDAPGRFPQIVIAGSGLGGRGLPPGLGPAWEAKTSEAPFGARAKRSNGHCWVSRSPRGDQGHKCLSMHSAS
jgi:hypothetical protein